MMSDTPPARIGVWCLRGSVATHKCPVDYIDQVVPADNIAT